ncbi:hypothetical protein CRUP_027342, partial [Coryphaenoides rupestris]
MPTVPLLPVVVEAPLSTTSSSSSSSNDDGSQSPEWFLDTAKDHQNHWLLRGSPPPHGSGREEPAGLQAPPTPAARGTQSPAKPPRTTQPRVIKVELHPNNENQFLQQFPPSSPKLSRAAVLERSGTTPTSTSTPTATATSTSTSSTTSPRAPPPVTGHPDPEGGLPKVGFGMDLPPDTPSEDEDSSWTTLSQETPSPQTPNETADLWTEGELPPGWREVSASSEVYFWHVPTGTTQYHRPVVTGSEGGDQGTSPPPPLGDPADAGPDPQQQGSGETLQSPVEATLPGAQLETVDLNSNCTDADAMSFPVRSLGWVEMAERDLCEGRSSVAVHHCIRQLSYCRRDIRDSAGVWGE